MRMTIRGVARVVAAALAVLSVALVVIELGRAAVTAMQPDPDQLIAAVEEAVPPNATLTDGVQFTEGWGWGNLLRWYPPVPGEAAGDVAGAEIDEVGQHLVELGAEPTSFGSLPAYDHGLILIRLADVGHGGNVSVVARQDPPWWMYLHGPIGAVAGLAAGWQVMRASARDQQ